MWRQARRNPIVCRAGRQNGLSDSLKSPARVKKIDQQKAARPPCPLVLKSTQISHLVKVPNPPPTTFQLQRGRLADGYSEKRCNSREKRGFAGSSLAERLPKKEKAWRSLSFRIMTYVEVLACNRSDSGHHKFSSVRGACSWRGVRRHEKCCSDKRRRVHHARWPRQASGIEEPNGEEHSDPGQRHR